MCLAPPHEPVTFYADLAPAADLTAVTSGMSAGPLEKEREVEEDMPQIDEDFEEDLQTGANTSLERIRASTARTDAFKSEMRGECIESITSTLRSGNLPVYGTLDEDTRLVHICIHDELWGKATPWLMPAQFTTGSRQCN